MTLSISHIICVLVFRKRKSFIANLTFISVAAESDAILMNLLFARERSPSSRETVTFRTSLSANNNRIQFRSWDSGCRPAN